MESQPQPKLLKPGLHFNVPVALYRADPGYNQSALKAFGEARTPAHYRYEADHPTLQDKDFIRIGSYVDDFLFGGDMEKYCIAPDTYPCEATKKDPRTAKPWTYQANYCTDWRDTKKAKGFTVLTTEELNRANGCITAVNWHEDWRATLKLCVFQVVVIAIHPTLGYRLKGAIDMYPKMFIDWIWDGKTGDDASVPGFTHKAEQLGYNIQSRFYMDLLRWCPEEIEVNNFGFFVVESEPPHGVNTHFTTYDSPECVRAAELISQWLPAYHKCVTEGKWPSYPAQWNKLMFKKWALEPEKTVPTLV